MLIDGGQPAGTPAGAADTGAGAGAGGAAPATDTSSMSDMEILDSPSPVADPAAPSGDAVTPPPAADGAAADQPPPPVDDGPAWIKTIADEKLRAEALSDFESLKAFREAGFTDPAAAKAIAEVLPGGREQLDTLINNEKAVAEQQAAIQSGDPAKIQGVVDSWMQSSGDKFPLLFRSGAQKLAQANPAAWNEIAGELLKGTLEADGMGEMLSGLAGAIERGDAEFAGKFLQQAAQWAEKRGLVVGGKAATRTQDPEVARLRQEAEKAQNANTEMRTTAWNGSRESTIGDVRKSVNASIASALQNVLPENAAPQLKDRLTKEIYDGVNEQMGANSWLGNRITELIGTPDKPRLDATKADWQKAQELSANAAKGLVPKAAQKVIAEWTKITVLKGNETAARAAAAGQKTEVGSAGGAPSNGKAKLTKEQIASMSDMDILNS